LWSLLQRVEADEDRAKVKALLARMSPTEAAKALGVTRSSVYRLIS
jgi:hypothetical protein